MPRHKSRRLWLKLRFNAPGMTRREVLNALLLSIENGDYAYPRGWRVAIGWSNKENGALKWGEWTKEMSASAESSEGWQLAVQSYLENQL